MIHINPNVSIAVMIGMVGGVTGLILFGNNGFWTGGFGMAGLAAVGALIGGFICAGFFGRSDRAGFGWAIVGAAFSTAIGAGLAGLIFGGAEGLLFAPVFVFMGLAVQPAAGLAWIAMMAAVHLTGRQLRRAVAQGETECSDGAGTIRP